MKDILEKVSSYKIFNYLLPGVIFAVIMSNITPYKLIQDNLIVGAFTYYFIGLIISRIGSLAIEPILKKISFVKFTDHKDYVNASKKDLNIEIFSEINNMYRSFASMFLLIILIKIYIFYQSKYLFLQGTNQYIWLILLFILFLISYKKQTKHITKRIILHNNI